MPTITNPPPAFQIDSFTAIPSGLADIVVPATVELQWQTTGATGVTITGIGAVAVTGSAQVTIEETTTFVLTAFDASLTQMASRSIVVTAAPELADRLVPNYTIIPYSGSTAPPGWVLCDGSVAGVPDLSGKFVVGVGSAALDATGPAESHVHSTDSVECPPATTADGGSHSHLMPILWMAQKFDNDSGKSTAGISTNGVQYSDSSTRAQSAGLHHHLAAVIIRAATSSASDEARPPWYALCYIMKVPE